MSLKTKKLAIAQRRQKVANLYLQGRGQVEIAQALGLTQATISKDLEKIRAAWRESAIRDFDAQRDLEIARLNQIEQEAWRAWERSQQPAQSAVVNGATGSQTARRTMKHQYGDPRFLELALRCNEERRKIMGLDAPTKIAPTTPDGRPLTVEQRKTHILAILQEQFGGKTLALHSEVTTYGTAASTKTLGESDGRRTPSLESVGDDQESLAASPASRIPGSDL